MPFVPAMEHVAVLIIMALDHFSQEVAFYNGNKKEQHILVSAFNKLKDHTRGFIWFKFFEGLVDTMIVKCMFVGEIIN